MSVRRSLGFLLAVLGAGALLWALQSRFGSVPPLGTLLDPQDGLYRTARQSVVEDDSTRLQIDGLDGPVTIVRDDRFVPHIFASSDRDAVIALGYVTAKDRLFQLDFIPRVASGRLSEAFGPAAVERDRFLRRTGMEWGARKNLTRIREDDGIELSLIQWYAAGVNAYLDRTGPADLPIEFRLLGYAPDRYTPLQALRFLQYMTFDLTYGSDDSRYALAQKMMADSTYRRLFPREPAGLYEPIIPPGTTATAVSAQASSPTRIRPSSGRDAAGSDAAPRWDGALTALRQHDRRLRSFAGTLLEGFREGKGSNNWAVAGSRSDTGAPILAGDMHLSLSLPPIWYEAHLVTPTMNTYGLTVPGAPILIEAFNRNIAWAFTNTGADQIDHYALTVDSTRSHYRFEGAWRDLRVVPDTIPVRGGDPVIDTLYYSHHGPVRFPDPIPLDTLDRTGAIAHRWVAHDSSRTLRALWEMNHASNLEEFEAALRYWDTPMQNILYAGTDGHIAIRSTGYVPIRKSGHGRGLLDGTTDDNAWTGRIPFDELPYSRDPAQGYLASSNQKPTGPEYPYYLGHNWRDGWRSLRLDTLLQRSTAHSVADVQAYQADVDVQQRDVFVPLLMPLEGLTPRADTLRQMLHRWDGEAGVDRPEPLVLDVFLERLHDLTWDETVFAFAPPPENAPFLELLRENPGAPWFDVQSTEAVEDGPALLALALEATADSLEARHGWDRDDWRWGDHHGILFRHLTRSEALRPFWRGPHEYPGFASTVSPARGLTTTHSASQRLIVDFSGERPTGIGVVPGGQSGNPLHPSLYDAQLSAYLNFEYFDLLTPSTPGEVPADRVRTTTRLVEDDPPPRR